MMGDASAVLTRIGEVRRWQEDLYRDLHRNPELSHQEHRTAAKVADRLGQCGFEVHGSVGGTGVVGVVRSGNGPTVLLRADMDALPLREATGLAYASDVTATGPDGHEVPVAHACGHDMHTTCLAGAAQLLASGADQWRGTLVALFQPAEETGDGARSMIDDGLAQLIPRPDVAFAQHILPAPAGQVGTRAGPVLSAADSMKITLYGRGGHGSMPQATVDPVVVAATIVVRLQTIVAREIPPTETAVLTVGRLHAGTKSNIIPDQAELQLNVRTYSEATRQAVLDAIRRIVTAECQASRCPKEPAFELFDRFPLTSNDPTVTQRLAGAFASFFGDHSQEMSVQTASEDFSDIPAALGTPYSYWGVGCINRDTYAAAAAAGRISQDIPVNHAPNFAPVIQPTCDTGTQALVVAAMDWLGS
jgi:hippurate hydrolase